MPVCWIIAGPNGAGKTTFALRYLPQVARCRYFINADLIAAGLAPLAPETQQSAAGRLFLAEAETAIHRGEDFGLETTLAGQRYRRLILQLRDAGWSVELVYLALPGVALAERRVLERVAHGGHHIPVTEIRRRFPRSLQNLLGDCGRTATCTRCFMNSGQSPELVFEQTGDHLTIHHQEHYQLLQHLSQP